MTKINHLKSLQIVSCFSITKPNVNKQEINYYFVIRNRRKNNQNRLKHLLLLLLLFIIIITIITIMSIISICFYCCYCYYYYYFYCYCYFQAGQPQKSKLQEDANKQQEEQDAKKRNNEFTELILTKRHYIQFVVLVL